ncbi:MAG TPA: glycosyltransferase family 2 protein [Pirellulales bacterium]|nr:glycosyltransferase family 2 protein [Pirellulales bacterium]
MIRNSVIIPQQDRGDEVRRQLPGLAAVLDKLGEPYEIVVVDDGSSSATQRLLEKLLMECRALRALRLDQPAGVSVALAAGIRAARGEVLIALEPGLTYPPEQIPALLNLLQRGDLVMGRRRHFGAAKLWQRIGRVPRWLLLGLDGHDPDCLFWAARREVFSDLNLTAGMARYLPALVRPRGFRVCEAYVQRQGPAQPLQDLRANPGDLLAAWWHCRRWRSQTVCELFAGGMAERPALRIVGGGENSMRHDHAASEVAFPSGQHPPLVKRA